MGSATVQRELWGVRANDWAQIQEGAVLPLYQAVLQEVNVESGTTLLDVGCGSGMFCQMAAELGAKVAGIDATAELLEIARERVPQGDFRIGEMEELPYSDNSFDIVTGFNSFQYASSPVNALRQARRVARPQGAVVIAVWGKAEDTEAAAYLSALGSLLPQPPPGAPGPFALSQDGALEALVKEAGLKPKEVQEVDCIWAYPDEETALKGLLSAGPAIRAINTSGEERVREAVIKAIDPYKTESGDYRLKNKFRYLITAA